MAEKTPEKDKVIRKIERLISKAIGYSKFGRINDALDLIKKAEEFIESFQGSDHERTSGSLIFTALVRNTRALRLEQVSFTDARNRHLPDIFPVHQRLPRFQDRAGPAL